MVRMHQTLGHIETLVPIHTIRRLVNGVKFGIPEED
jgi:hypothetical protein